MFKELGQLASLLPKIKEIKAEMDRLQQRLGQLSVEGDAGGGMVKVRANGRLEVLSCTISAELLAQNDRELLEDLVRAATNQALEKARQQAADETAKAATAFGIPAGLGLPGLPG